nr:hypothetical protein Itr_chr13CG14620 [Ipomoea trifida]
MRAGLGGDDGLGAANGDGKLLQRWRRDRDRAAPLPCSGVVFSSRNGDLPSQQPRNSLFPCFPAANGEPERQSTAVALWHGFPPLLMAQQRGQWRE